MSLQCSHASTSLVRGWDEGKPFVLEQCDRCGAVGPAPEGKREGVDPFSLAEVDIRPLLAHLKEVDKEIARLERLLKPGNPQMMLALEGARINGGAGGK